MMRQLKKKKKEKKLDSRVKTRKGSLEKKKEILKDSWAEQANE